MFLNGIISVVSGNDSASILYVNKAELKTLPNFTPEVVVGEKLVASCSDEEVVYQHSDEQVNEQQS